MSCKVIDKNGLVILGNGPRHEYKLGDIIQQDVFDNDFPGASGNMVRDALLGSKRIEKIGKEKEVEITTPADVAKPAEVVKTKTKGRPKK